MNRRFYTLKFKIIVTTVLCVALVSLVSNFYLYHYLTNIIEQKAERIQQMYLSTLRSQLDQYIHDTVNFGLLCANDSLLTTALDGTAPRRSDALRAQDNLNAFLTSCPVLPYIDKLVAFNRDGLVIQASTRKTGTNLDLTKIHALPLYDRLSALSSPPPFVMGLTPSIVYGKESGFGLLCPVTGLGYRPGHSFIYIEVGLDLFENALSPYTELNNIFLAQADGALLTALPEGLPADFPVDLVTQGKTELNGTPYLIERATLSLGELSLYSCISQTALRSDTSLRFPVLVTLLTVLLLAVLLAVIVSAYLTRPIRRLNDRLHRVADNDFSFDPEIERPRDEIGQIGHTVNEMTMSISHLLDETQDMYEKRQRIEISLLQSQVNPHFLYNTLDSIHWMARLQKSDSIANMTRSLANLLKNIAKGTQDKITLREELDLLGHYIAIQNVRYVETFTWDCAIPETLLSCRIVKLTLQPLVENAIFHGIEPTGRCGVIRLTAQEAGNDLVLTVEDNGAGIAPEHLRDLLTTESTRNQGACDAAALEPLQQAGYLERYAALRIAFNFSPVPNSEAFSAGDIARLYHCHKDLAEKLARNLFAHCVILAPREESDCNALFVFCHHFPETEQWIQTVAAYCTKLKSAGAVITQAQTFVLATDLFSGAQSTECFRKQLFALRDHHYIAEVDGLPYSQLPEIAWESLAMNGFFSRLCVELRAKNATAVRLLLERAIERVRAVPHPHSQGLWLCSEVYRAVRTTKSEMPSSEGGTLFSAAGSTAMGQFSTRRQVAYWLEEATNELCSDMEQSGCAKAEMVEKAKQYVQDNIDKRIMLQDVADFVCISPGYLSALFKKVHQQNFVDYLNHVKVERACTLIQAQALRIGEISDRLGFENACYFSRVFKRYKGLTPTEYQKKQRREAAPD